MVKKKSKKLTLNHVVGLIVLIIGVIVVMNIPYAFTKIITKGEINCHETFGEDMRCYDKFGEEIQNQNIRFILLAVSLSLIILYVFIFAIYFPRILKKLNR